jgi:signal recognition particle subunit SRP54
VPVHSEGDRVAPLRICRNGVERATREGYTSVLIDTAGRLQLDDTMMRELESIKELVSPREILLVVDSMTGQEAVSVADEFNKRLGVTGLLLTKVDGDARGGAALSARAVTGVPIKFMGTGEKPGDLEPFYPDRLASRILGMGDVLTLIERAEATFDQKQAEDLERKMRTSSFTLEDFVEQLKAVKSMGSINDLLAMIPGMSQVTKQLPSDATEKSIKTTEAIINSMTREERRSTKVMNASRKRRIARGSGTSVQEVNNLLRQFEQMQQMMKQLQSGRGMRGIMPRLR